MADDELLSEINRSGAGSSESYDAMSHFGEQAVNASKEYASNNCPEYGREQQQAANENNEYQILSKIFGYEETPDNFGESKIGVCRISNCPSHGESKWWYKKTLVGGCNICVGCHHLFSKGKSPEKVHKLEKRNAEKRLEKIVNKKKSKEGMEQTN